MCAYLSALTNAGIKYSPSIHDAILLVTHLYVIPPGEKERGYMGLDYLLMETLMMGHIAEPVYMIPCGDKET